MFFQRNKANLRPGYIYIYIYIYISCIYLKIFHVHLLWKISSFCYRLKNKRQTWCHMLFYFTSCILNMFRTLIYPSSGASDCVVELPHPSSCSQFIVCWSFGMAGFEWCSCCRMKRCFSLQHGNYSNPATPNPQLTTNREQDDRCGDSRTQSQASDDGYINVRNMLRT